VIRVDVERYGLQRAVSYAVSCGLLVGVYFNDTWHRNDGLLTFVRGCVPTPETDPKRYTEKLHIGGFLVLENDLQIVADKRKIKSIEEKVAIRL
jgi:hypothetical protein